MKRFILPLALILIASLLFACGKKQSKKDMSALFDKKPSEITGETENSTNTPMPVDTSNDTPPAGTDNENPENSTDSENDDNGSESHDNTGEQTQQLPEYKHSEAEVSTIINRYIEAEDFYYTLLYQRYDLDGYDIILRNNSDGYNTEYHRVLYYDVNSKSELQDYYRRYFTESFVSKVDFNSYIEENGKLYCAQTENAAGQQGAKYLYTVESVDPDTAYVIRSRTDGTAMQKVSAEKIGEIWYFGGVAIG